MPDDTTELTDLLVDTHVHTHYSDGVVGVKRIERFCENRGIGVAITDHNEIRGATSLLERERVPTLPGIEVGTEEGLDLLVYFPSGDLLERFYVQAIEPNLRMRFMVRSWIQSCDCLEIAKEMGGYISLAHPFAIGRKSLDYQHGRRGKSFVASVMESIDAIELYNGGILKRANNRARLYADTAGKRLTVGSDSHRLGTIGSCGTFMRTPADNATPSLFHALKSADDLRFKMKGSATTSTLPMFGLIALKHTHHFVRAKARRRKK